MYKTVFSRILFTNANDFPSLETTGLAAPHGPPVTVIVFPVEKSYRLMAYI